MKYLLYLRDGLVKKFPLSKEITYLGRGRESDFYIDEEFISRKHAMITCFESKIKIEDLNSKNGVYVADLKVDCAEIGINESFRIGSLEFYLKSGNPEEFDLSKDTKPVLQRISQFISSGRADTKTGLNLFEKTLVATLQLGFKLDHFDEILKWARKSLLTVLKSGFVLVVDRQDNDNKIISSLNLEMNGDITFNSTILKQVVFHEERLHQPVGKYKVFCSFPIRLGNRQGVLLYIKKKGKHPQPATIQFLQDLASEIALIYRLIEYNSSNFQTNNNMVDIVTRSEPMINLLNQCKKIAPSELMVLIEGETGTGKELLARFIHQHSRRDRSKYVGINCSAIPETLLEDDLFGHEKGAFSGAHSRRPGKLEQASGGTLLLDEIGDMSLELQAKLLRVLQEREYCRLGSNECIQVDLRIISLTNKNLATLVTENRFREDLFYRVAPFKIQVPPLRERREDIQPLIHHFLEKFSLQSRLYVSGFSRHAIEALQQYSWPGNVRELENEINCLINRSCSGDIIGFDLLKEEIKSDYRDPESDELRQSEAERNRLVKLLAENRWNKSRVARKLNISRTALYKRMIKYKIEK